VETETWPTGGRHINLTSALLNIGSIGLKRLGVRRVILDAIAVFWLTMSTSGHESALRAVGRIECRCIRVPGGDVADAAETVASGT
jgi:hypothetical protein